MLPLGPLFQPLQTLGLIPKPLFTTTEKAMEDCCQDQCCDETRDAAYDAEKFVPMNGWYVVQPLGDHSLGVIKKAYADYAHVQVGDTVLFEKVYRVECPADVWVGKETEIIGMFPE